MNKIQTFAFTVMALFGMLTAVQPSLAQTFASGTSAVFPQGTSQVQVPPPDQGNVYYRQSYFPMMRMMWGSPSGDYGYYGYGTRYHWGIGMMLAIAFFWILVVALIIGLLRRVFGWRRRGYHHASSALDILNERYARGEIDKTEYENRKKDILS